MLEYAPREFRGVVMTHSLSILAGQEREVLSELLDDLGGTEHRLAASHKLNNSLLTILEEGSVLVGDVDHRGRASLVDGGGDENHGQQSRLASAGGHVQIELRHGESNDVKKTEYLFWRGMTYYLQTHRGSQFLRTRQKFIQSGQLAAITLIKISPVMSSYGSVLPTAARGILSSCRAPLSGTSMAPAFSTFQQVRGLKTKTKGKGKSAQPNTKSKRGPADFVQKNLKDMPQWALCDAMRYVFNPDPTSQTPAHQLTV